MRFYLYTAILLIFSFGCTPDNEDSPTPEEVFVKYYGDQSSHKLYDMQVLPSGGFVLFGTKREEGSPTGSDFYLIETDASGNMIKDESFDIASTEDIAAKIKVIGSGYLITGSVANLNAALIPQAKSLYWAHLDQDFGVVNESRLVPSDYTTSTSSDDEVEGKDIIFLERNPTDSVMVIGSSNVNGQGEIVIHKASLAGETQWNKLFGQTGSDETATAIFETENNEFAVISTTSNTQSLDGASGSNIILYLFNSSVSSQDNSVIVGYTDSESTDYNDVAISAYKTAGGGEIVVTGSSALGPVFRPFLVSFNQQGGIITPPQVFNNSFGNARGTGVTKTSTNNYVIVGTIESFVDTRGTENTDDDLSKGDEILFQKAGIVKNFGTENGNDEAAVVKTLSDGSLLVGGTVDFGSGFTLITLMKMNDNGELAQ